MKRRPASFESLEARRVFAAAIWHNVLQPFNVNDDGGGAVSPIDALMIINELNTPQYRDPRTGALPTQVPDGTSPPLLDTTCDGFATALDALLVINAINVGVPNRGWTLGQSNSGSTTAGHVVSSSCSPKLIEGDSLFTELAQTITLPDSNSSIRVSYEAPQFDTSSSQTMRDAFEIALLDVSGQPLVLPYSSDLEASFNWSEGQTPIAGPGTQSITQTSGSVSTATFNLAGIAAGTKVQVVTRLVNNDRDVNSSVVLRRVETIASTAPASIGMAAANPTTSAAPSIDRSAFSDVTSGVAWNFGRSTLSDDHSVLTTDVQVQNKNATAISGRLLLVVENTSDPNVVLSQPDGYLEFGQPYFILQSNGTSDWLAAGESTSSRQLNFRNLDKQQFELNFRVLAQHNAAPTGFTSQPLLEIEAGQHYLSNVQADDPDEQTLSYSKVAGPTALTIDSATGKIDWSTQTSDVGNHYVVIRATDPYGLSVDLPFTIAVRSSLANRPPIITSTPGTSATASSPFEVVTLATGPSPAAAAVGDFGMRSGNGLISLITADAGSQALSLLTGSGADRFAGAKPVSVGEPQPSKYGTPFVTAATVDLGFLPGTYSNKERNVLSLVTEDINRDGIPDFAVSINTDNSNTGPGDVGSVGVRLGNGDGTFRDGWQVQLPSVTLGTTGQSSRADSIRLADVTGDGLVDFVAVQSWGNRVLVYAGQGDGNFTNTPITSEPASVYGYTSQLGDMNGDGKLDLVTYENRESRFRFGTTVRLGDGAGNFGAGVFYPGEGDGGRDGYLADVNSDGAFDSIRLNPELARVEVRLNDGTGGLGDVKFSRTYFIQANNFNSNQNNALSAYLDDYDGDNKQDILVSTYTSNFFLLKGNNNGTFGNNTEDGNRLITVNTGPNYSNDLQFFPSAGRNDGRAPDLNGDGKPDFVFGNQQTAELTTAINDGTGHFTTNVYLSGFSDDGGNGSVRGANATPFVNVADYNRDGVSDVLLGRMQSADRIGGVGIALGDKAAGSLRLPKVNFVQGSLTLQAGNGASVVGDFDEDGIDDLATLSANRIYVARGNGDGSLGALFEAFSAGTTFLSGPLVMDDFDKDGHIDLATGDGLPLFGLGNGTFQAMARLSMPSGYFGPQQTSSLQGVATGDVNGDSYPDLIYRLPNNHSNFATETILAVFLYRPSEQKFLAVTDTEHIFSLPRRTGFYNDGPVGFEDLDGDGHRELFAHSLSITQGDQVVVPQRFTIWQPTFNASATDASDLFSRTEIANPGFSPNTGGDFEAVNAFFVTDLNHDGHPDLVLGTRNGEVTTSFGNGDFTFDHPTSYSTNQVMGFRMLDVNGDDLLDIVPLWGSSFYNFNDLNNTGVLLGRVDGSFGEYQGLSMSNYDLSDVIGGDFNGDGYDDLSFSHHLGARLTVLSRGPGLSEVATGDLDGDGLSDVVAIDTGLDRVKVLLGGGDNTFTRQPDLFTDLGPVDLLLHDFNADGKLDILTANAAGKSISLFINSGTGNFSRSDIELDQQPSKFVVGDVNNDGRTDITIVSAAAETLTVLKGLANGFDGPITLPIGFAADDLGLADLTQDGKLDVLLSDHDGRRLVMLPGLGSGGFGSPVTQPLSDQPGKLAISDLNADGRLDVIATYPDADKVGILFGRGGGRWTNPQFIAVGMSPIAVSIADVNGDQLPDAVVTNQGDNTVSVILNRFDPASVYHYELTATDPDADPVTFDMINAPGGAIYDDATQTISWAPMPDQIGANAWLVQASDGRGGQTQQGFTVLVTAPVTQNQPQFTSQPASSIAADATFTYQPRVQLTAAQSAGTELQSGSETTARFTLIDGPAGATIDPITGRVEWDPREQGISLGVRGAFGYPNRFESRADVIVPFDSSLNTKNFTAEGWFRFDSIDGIISLFKKEHSGVPFSSSTYSSWNLQSFFGTLHFEMNDFKGSVDVRLDTIRLTTNTWMHIAVTYDDSNRQATIYVNGQAVGSAVSAASPEFTSGVLRTVGVMGTLSQMRVWNRSRSATEIQQDMVSNIPSTAPGLILDYQFQEGPNALSIVDASPLANDGRLSVNSAYNLFNFPPRVPAIAFASSQAFTIGIDDGRGGVTTQSFTVQVVPPPARMIRGLVFVDSNGSGVQDATESGLAGQTVYIDRNDNHRLDSDEPSAVTDAAGNYSLAVIGGEIIVALASSPNFQQTLPSQANRKLNLLTDTISSIQFGVQPTEDKGPSFFSTPPTSISVPGHLNYQFFAQTTDGSPIVYSLAHAPAGMSIDGVSGLLQWSPRLSDAGTAEVIVKAMDGQGRVAAQRFELTVDVNTNPIITSVFPVTANVAVPYWVDVTAQDAEQSQLSYSLVNAPTGVTLDPLSGQLRWTPSAAQLGEHTITIAVSDARGGNSQYSYQVQVLPTATNRLPIFTVSESLTAQVGTLFINRAKASDADGDRLTYRLLSGPAGVTVASDGQITWTPTELGSFNLRIEASDGRGGVAETSLPLVVIATLKSAQLRITSQSQTLAIINQLFAYDVVTTGAVHYELVQAPIGMSIDPVHGWVRWLPTVDQLGPARVEVRAIDALGGIATQTFTINVLGSTLSPAITSTPSTSAAVGSTYVYLVTVSNPTANPLTFALLEHPAGMSINALNGVVDWTPASSQVGPQRVIVRVQDGVGNYITQAFSVIVASSLANRPPVTTSAPPLDAIVGTIYEYRLVASDPDSSSSTLAYSVLAGPAGMSIDATGRVTWTPIASQIGSAQVTLRAADAAGAASIQSYIIDVRAANRTPTISSAAPTTVPQGGLFQYDVIATDADREPLFFELVSSPAGATIDSLGRIRWQTALDTATGSRAFSVRVRDGRGSSTTQDFAVNVVADTQAPKVSILIGYSGVLFPWTKEPAVVKVQATDNVAVAQISLVVDGKPVALRSDGTADVFFSGAGNGRLIATAVDPAGNRGTTTSKINMCSGEEACIPDNSNTLPQVAITSLTEGDAVSGFVDIIGTASASDFDSFDISVRRGDQTIFTKIASSKTAVVGGLLARWDTTLLENDSYVIKLEARDIFGGYAAIEQLVGVSGNLKLGNFRLSFEDLMIPVAGLPITLIRSYDTLRSDQSGEFGYGWRMEFRDTNLRTSLTKSGLEEQGIYRAFQPGTKVYLTLPGGQREGFTFTPDIRVLPGFGGSLTIATPRFTPDAGVKNTLKVGSGNLLVNERGELYAAGGIPWNPASPDFEGYTLVTPEGTQYKIDGATGFLKSATDRNQNTLVFSESGVTSLDSGTGLTFERDLQHRITRVIDPAGNSLQYQYDSRGDLVKVIDRMGAVTQMTYRTNRRHYLDKVIDPLGRTGVKAEYGPDGRLTSTQDANGNTVRNSYDPNSSLVTVVDPLGNPTVYEYDPRGNIVSTTNALGAVTRMTYDENNSLLSETDLIGRTVRYTRDERGHELTRIDADGNVTQTTYDLYGNISSTTNAVGKTSRTRFDNRGNPVSTTSASGNVTEYSLNTRGQGAAVKLPGGMQMSVGYSSGAQPTTLTDAAGRTSTFEYNALGLVTRTRSTVTANNGTTNGPTESVESRSYDAEGRLVSITDVAGAITRFEYDLLGNLTAEIDGLGNRTRYEFNAAGQVTRRVRADGSVFLTSYDAAGRVASQTDPAGHVTQFVYDAAGQLTATVYPDDTPLTDTDNPRTRTEYNLAGDVVAEIDELGNRTEYEYDAIGRTAVVRNPLGAEVHMTYGPSGLVESLSNPLQQTTTYLYDINGSRVGTQGPDGSTIRQELDGRGFPIADVDQNGRATRYRYTPSGQLAQVTDALGGVTLYEYDASDRLVKQTDANGHVTQYEYNVRGQEMIRRLPGGQQWKTEYDLLGRVAKTIDPNGQTVTYQYDAVDRVVSKRRSDGVNFAFQYNANGQLAAVTDPRGETRYQYGVRNRLLSRTEPDGQVIGYTYDAAGRMRSMTTLAGTTEYTYDAAGRMTSVKDPAGGTTRYFYDAAGSLVRTELPNGIVETREYDINGRLVRQVSTAPAGGGVLTDFRYTLDATGRVLRQTGAGEIIDYQYDAAYRLTSEQSSTGRSLQWNYDAVGNRLHEIDTTGETIYQYDANDRLVRTTRGNVITEFIYDSAGNQIRSSSGTTSRRMVWDAENRLLSVEVTDASGVRTESYGYDAFGNRVAVINASGESKFLLDLTGALSQIVAEYRSNGQLVAVTIRGLELVGEIRDGQPVFFLRDRLDSVRAVTNSSGAVVATTSYDAFGNVVSSTGNAATAYRYAGEPRSKVSGLDHLRARSYDPTIGRFVSADSFAGHLTLPISRNRYIYASSDGVNHTDPTGNESLVEMQVRAAIVTTLITTSLGAGFGFVKAKLLGQDTTTQVITYAGVGFVVGIAVSLKIPGFLKDIVTAAETKARVDGVFVATYSTAVGATAQEIAGATAVAAAISELEMMTFVVKALEAVPWVVIGTLGAADLLFSAILSAAGDTFNGQIDKVKVRVQAHNEQQTQ